MYGYLDKKLVTYEWALGSEKKRPIKLKPITPEVRILKYRNFPSILYTI